MYMFQFSFKFTSIIEKYMKFNHSTNKISFLTDNPVEFPLKPDVEKIICISTNHAIELLSKRC